MLTTYNGNKNATMFFKANQIGQCVSNWTRSEFGSTAGIINYYENIL